MKHNYFEVVKQKIYSTRDDSKTDIFDYIELFYNRQRRRSHVNQMNPFAFKKLQTGS